MCESLTVDVSLRALDPSVPPAARNRRMFAIIASQRTGSTLLVRSLDSSPDIFCAGELFHTGPNVHHREYQYPCRYLGSRGLARLVERFGSGSRVHRHLDNFYKMAGEGMAAVGFKVMVSQIRARPAIIDFLRDHGVTRLFLYRQDTFATALSYYRAKVSGKFHSNRSARSQEPLSVTADEAQFRTLFEYCQHDKLQLQELHSRYGGRLIAYEDMVSGWDAFIAAFGADIDLPGLRVHKALMPVGSGSTTVCIANEDTLRYHFARHHGIDPKSSGTQSDLNP